MEENAGVPTKAKYTEWISPSNVKDLKNVRRYLSPKASQAMELMPRLLLQSRPDIVAESQRDGKGTIITSHWRKMASVTLPNVENQVTTSVMSCECQASLRSDRKGTSPMKPCNPSLIMREKSDKPRLGVLL